jgi:O-antigen ligase
MDGYQLAALIVAVAVIFFGAEHGFEHLERQIRFMPEDEIMNILADSATQGNRVRQIAFLSFAGLGIGLLTTGRGRAFRFDHPSAWLLGCYLAWCSLSVLWSDDPLTTLKRLIVVYSCILGGLGLARKLSTRNMALLGVSVAASFVVGGLLLEMGVGGFRPWRSEYRFGGTVHPNVMASYCVVVGLGSFYLRKTVAHKIAWTGLFVFALICLYLTKSRMSLAGLVVALNVNWVARLRGNGIVLTILFALGLCGSLLVSLGLGGPRFIDRLANAVLLGRTEEVGSLAGRIPLWEELLEYSAKRPWHGYGYATFWLPDRIATVTKHQQWAMSMAHSCYLETLLDVGRIGLGLLLAATLLAVITLARRSRRSSDSFRFGFPLSLMTYGLTHGTMESHCVTPMFVTLVCGVAFSSAIFFHIEDDRRDCA